MSAPAIAAWLMIRRLHQEEQERLNSLSNQQVNANTVNTNKITLPEAPPTKAPVSVFAALSIGLLILGFVIVVIGIALSLPYLIALGGFDALAAITLAVLSLREKQ